MSEAPHDIAYLKITAAEIVTPHVTPSTLGVWATYEVVNIGTAPTDNDHDVNWGAGFMGAAMPGGQGFHNFDPPLEANGGSYQGTINIAPEHLPFEGDWDLVIQCDLGIDKGISDSVHLPFTVSHTEPG